MGDLEAMEAVYPDLVEVGPITHTHRPVVGVHCPDDMPGPIHPPTP